MILFLFSMDFSSHVKKTVVLYQVINLKWNVLLGHTCCSVCSYVTEMVLVLFVLYIISLSLHFKQIRQGFKSLGGERHIIA